jgi:predicted Zn finger-like uncharacterized protein
MTSVLTAVCPECQVIYRIDPSRVPPGGLRARCTSCGAVVAIGLSMPPFVAAAAPLDPAALAASDAAAAPTGSDMWDWGAKERSRDAASVPPTSADDPWAGLWGEGDPSARQPAQARDPGPVNVDQARPPAGTSPRPPAIARRPRT